MLTSLSLLPLQDPARRRLKERKWRQRWQWAARYRLRATTAWSSAWPGTCPESPSAPESGNTSGRSCLPSINTQLSPLCPLCQVARLVLFVLLFVVLQHCHMQMLFPLAWFAPLSRFLSYSAKRPHECCRHFCRWGRCVEHEQSFWLSVLIPLFFLSQSHSRFCICHKLQPNNFLPWIIYWPKHNRPISVTGDVQTNVLSKVCPVSKAWGFETGHTSDLIVEYLGNAIQKLDFLRYIFTDF